MLSTQRNILCVLVQDVEGIITRISALFARRGFTIDSIITASTERPGISRITVVAAADDLAIEQIKKQLNKLVHVVKIVRMPQEASISRALMMIKVNADAATRPHVAEVASLFRARVIDVSPESMIIEATGNPGKLDALLEVLEPFGIREMARSGALTLHRGAKILR